MLEGLSTSLAGFNAAAQRLENSANNLANANSTAKFENDGTVSNEPYRPQTVQTVSQAQGGVTTVTTERSNPTIKLYDPSNSLADEQGFVEAPNVDVAEERVNQIISSYDAKANIKAIEIQLEVSEALLDIFG